MKNNIDKKVFDFFFDYGHVDSKGFRRVLNRMPGRGRPGLGKRGRRALLSARFDPNARDADNDGIVQEMTRFERPAGPRNIVQPLRSVNSPEGEDSLDDFMRDIQRNAPRRKPFRLTDPDDDLELDKPSSSKPDKPVLPGRRGQRPDRSRLIDPSKPPSYDNLRGPKTILPIVPGKPMVAEIEGMSRADWNNLVDEFEEYFQREMEKLGPKDKKVKALFSLRDSLKKIKVKESDNGIELDGRDWYYARIIKSFKAIKKQGTEFDNMDKLTDSLEKEMRRQGTSSRDIDLGQYWNTINVTEKAFSKVQADKRDPKKVSEEISRIEKKVERAFGKIETTQDALAAFNSANSNIIRHFHFLQKKDGRPVRITTLTNSERGLVFGYLNMFLEQPELKKFAVRFAPEKSGAGGSAQIHMPWDSDKTTPRDKVLLEIRYKSDDGVIAPRNKRILETFDRPLIGDTVSTQASSSYLLGNPDNLSDNELLARAEFIAEVEIARHEGTHVAHFVRALEDAFPGNDADGNKIMSAVRQKFLDEGKESVFSNYAVGQSYGLLNAFEERVITADLIFNSFESELNRHIVAFRRQEGRSLDASERESLEAYLIGRLFVEPDGRSLTRRGEIWNRSFPLYAIDFDDPSTLTRQNIVDGKNYARKQEKLIEKLLNTPKYRALKDAREAVELAELRLDEDGNILAPAVRNPRVEKVALQYPDLLREFWIDMLETYKPGSYQAILDKYNDEGYYQVTFRKMLAGHYQDDLTGPEQVTLRKIGKSISRYAGSSSTQFYGFQNGNAPVEVVAEMAGAINLGQLPKKGTDEYNVMKKFMTWLMGADYWNRIEATHG